MTVPVPAHKKNGNLVIRLIAAMKLLKALSLVAAGLAAKHLLHHDVEAAILNIVRETRIDADNRYVHALLHAALNIDDRKLRMIECGTFLYALLFSIEGVGLWLGKLWAEYFTIITTSLLIPLEVYEMFHHFRPAKAVLFLLNVAIVIYLIVNVRRRMQRERGEASEPAASSPTQSPANP